MISEGCLLCLDFERSRVLLTQNLWVEVGLMNGALGTVVGFVWPVGGDPASDDSALKSPLCVIVEFDGLFFGSRSQSFFPGEPGRERWVPIFRQKVFSASEASVYREQFPLVLAWALTHWKSQGMTLRRVRVRLSNRTAALPGVGFVSITRVRHPTHLVFEEDLPEWSVFQEAQFSANFRARRRFELRMRACFSRTLRKYGFCSADAWTDDDADVAGVLIGGLEAVAAEQRARMTRGGRAPDANAWLWPEGEPPFEALLQEQASQYGGGDAVREARAAVVARRLMEPLHMPAVREALGCLIPPLLHQRGDGQKPKGCSVSSGIAKVGVDLLAGKWKVDVSEEQQLATLRLSVGTCEFFLHVLRRLCQQLRLAIAIGSVALGRRLGSTDGWSDSSYLVVEGWQQWRPFEVRDAALYLLPVCVGDGAAGSSDWLLAAVRPGAGGGALGSADEVAVYTADNRDPPRPQLCASKGAAVAALFRRACPSARVSVQGWQSGGHAAPPCAESRESLLWCLGLVVNEILQMMGAFAAQPAGDDFLENVRQAAVGWFASLRASADETGDRDVLPQLSKTRRCHDLLQGWSSARVPRASQSAALRAAAARDSSVRGPGPGAPKAQMRFVTWNIAQAPGLPGKSAQAPDSWTRAENLSSIEQELLRWSPDVVALQECPSAAPLARLRHHYELVGASVSHAGFVHLYRRPGAALERVPLRDVPAVVARVQVGGLVLHVVAVHLRHGSGSNSAHSRRVALRKALRHCTGDAVMVLGDFNIREEEGELAVLLAEHGLREAPYPTPTWDPSRSRYHSLPEGEGYAAAARFDRVLSKGSAVAEVYVAGANRVFADGVGFVLSDHAALMALVDVHGSHCGSLAAGKPRRAVLSRLRDGEAGAESSFVRLRDYQGRREAWMQRDAAAQRRVGVILQRARALTRERAERLDALSARVLGSKSLFRTGRAVPLLGASRPPRCADVASEFWGGPAQNDQGHAVLACTKWASRSDSSGCAAVVCQLLAHLPAVSRELESHRSACDGRGACAACAAGMVLAAVRSFDGGAAAVRLAALVGAARGKCGSDSLSPGALLRVVVEDWRAAEVRLERCVPWVGPIAAGLAEVTCVDHLCSFIVESRFECRSCSCGGPQGSSDCTRVSLAACSVLCLDLLAAPGDYLSMVELYLSWCAPCSLLARCAVCGVEEVRTVERRIVTEPRILFVVLNRAVGGAGADGRAVELDESMTLPGVGALQLVGAFFESTELSVATCRAVSCLVRAAGRPLFFCDVGSSPVALSLPVGRVKPREVQAVAYVCRPPEPGAPVDRQESLATAGADDWLLKREAALQRQRAVRDASVLGARLFNQGLDAGTAFEEVLFEREGAAENYMLMLEDDRVRLAVAFRADLRDFDEFVRLCRDSGLLFDDLKRFREARAAALRPQPKKGAGADPSSASSGRFAAGQMRTARQRPGASIGHVPVASVTDSSGRGASQMGVGPRGGQQLSSRDSASIVGPRRGGGGVTPRAGRGRGRALGPPMASKVLAPIVAGAFEKGVANEAGISASAQGRAPGQQSTLQRSRQAGASVLEPGRPHHRRTSDGGGAHASGCDDGSRVVPGFSDGPVCRLLSDTLARGGLAQGIFAELRQEFGDAGDALLDESWSCDWKEWAELLAFASCVGPLPDDAYLTAMMGQVRVIMRKFKLLAVQNRATAQCTDGQRRAALRRDGFVVGRASGDANNCLADSLLQLLVAHSFVRGPVSDAESTGACRANREALSAQPLLRPRDLHGSESRRAYLEHDRHAAPTVEFFAAWFADRWLRPMPPGGFELHVYTRFDSSTWHEVCVLSRPGGAPVGAPHKLHMYNSSGRGVWGFHYDPVFLVARSSPAASSSATPQASSAPSVRGSGDVDKLCALPGGARLSSQRGPRTLRRTGSAWPPTPGELRDGGVELLRARFAGVAVSAPDAANQSVAGSRSEACLGQLPAGARGTPASSQRCSAPGGPEAQHSSHAASGSATSRAPSAQSVRGSGDGDKLCALLGGARLSSQRGPRTLRRTGSALPPTPGELRDGGVELLRAKFAGVAVSEPDAANQSVAGSCSAAGFGQLPADARGTPASSQRCSAPGGSEAQRPAASGVASSAAGAPPVVALSKRGVGLGGSLLKRRR